jgi:chromate transporter
MSAHEAGESISQVGLAQLAIYFFRLGAVGFGGPIALVGHMQKDLVDERRWFSQQDYLQGLAFCQLSPGPLAAQLAIYLGWLHSGILGASLTGVAFIAPSFLMVVALADVYVRYGGLSWIQGAFYGIGAAVVAIIARSAVKLVRGSIGKDWLLWAIFFAMAFTTAWKNAEIVWLFIICGFIAMLWKAPPRPDGRNFFASLPLTFSKLITGVHGIATAATISTLFLFFVKAGAFVFGSGLAIVPFLYGGVVTRFQWLNERQFVDAVAIAMITPGPVVITAGFIGYLVAGFVGALAAAFAVFAPPYFFVLLGAPYYRRFASVPRIKAFVQGVTAAAVGAIAGAAYVLARRSVTDIPTILIAMLVFVLLSFRKIPEPLLIGAAAVAGVLIRGKFQ